MVVIWLPSKSRVLIMSGAYSHHFSACNVPFGIASSDAHPNPQAATRLGNVVVFLHDAQLSDLFSGISGLPPGVFAQDTLNDFAALPAQVHKDVRQVLRGIFEAGEDQLGSSRLPNESVESIAAVKMHMPVRVGDFVGKSTLGYILS